MKITSVKCHVLTCKVERPFSSSRGWFYTTKGACLTEITTDEGIVGWGESSGPAAVNRVIVETQLAPCIIGRDPFDVEIIWEELYNRIKDYGRAGMNISALSGIDIALWDIIGKACHKPVHKLIGGAFRPSVQAYATGMYFHDMDRVLEEAVEEATRYVNDGFKAVKMKIGLGSIMADFQRVAAVRKAIGPDIRLMVDANHSFNVTTAIQMGRKLESLDVAWFEEPVAPEDLDGYALVAKALDMPVTGGENLFTRHGIRDVMTKRAMDIVQPDVCTTGGISEAKKIATLASTFGIECMPHAWGSAVGLAATLHFLATIPPCPLCLVPSYPMLEFEQTYNPFRTDLAVEPITHKEGFVLIPTKPGLGIEIDKNILAQYAC